MIKKKKNVKWILAAVVLIVVIVLIIVLAKSYKKKYKEWDEEKQDEIINNVKIESGYYFGEEPVSCVKINEDGTAAYYPDFIANYNFEGVYSISNNVLTIQKNADYWKFKIIDEQLHLIQIRTGGVVSDCRKDNKIYTKRDTNPGLMSGITYHSDDSMYLYYSDEDVRLYKYDQLICMEREFTFEDNVLKFGDDDDRVTFIYKDNRFYLQDSWIDGKYYEFSKRTVEFVSVFDELYNPENEREVKNIVISDLYDDAKGGMTPGYYYNSDLSAELVIEEDNWFYFYPDTQSSYVIEGRYECIDGKMVLMELFYSDYYDYVDNNLCIGVEYYIFTQKEDRLVYAKYLDLYGNITEYDENEKTTFSYSEKPLINTLRPGAYVGKLSEEKYSFKLNIWVDNNGIASVYYNMDINYTGDEESGEGLDLRGEYVMLDYEVDNDNICITIDEYSELTATIKNGNIIINNFIDFTNGTSLSNEIECKYEGSSLNYFFNH